MTLAFEELDDTFIVIPTIIITEGSCEDATCTARHWRVSVAFLFWEFCVYI